MNVELPRKSNVEKVKYLRTITLSPVNKINEALARANGDEAEAVKILVAEKQVDANDMANRVANTKIVYSYVHNNRIGAMIVLACQTDFVAKTEAFLNLAKNICMHIVSTPIAPEYIDATNIPQEMMKKWTDDYLLECVNKPPAIAEKIVRGKIAKFVANICLLNQPFIRDDKITIAQLIADVSATVGEKIEVSRFIKMTAQ